METVWIQVFVLTLSECVAPAGKTVCQDHDFELQFLTEADCQVALQQLVSLKRESADVIVNTDRSGCAPAAKERTAYASLDELKAAFVDSSSWKTLPDAKPEPGVTQVSHRERLANLKSCDESNGVAPCKIGEIIIEGASGDPVEVWRRN
jgi:hypothetical protein